jgi:hypothetical protein
MGASSEVTDWEVSSIGEIDLRVELGDTGGRDGLLLTRFSGGFVAIAGMVCVLAMMGPVTVAVGSIETVLAQPAKMAMVPVNTRLDALERRPRRPVKG